MSTRPENAPFAPEDDGAWLAERVGRGDPAPASFDPGGEALEHPAASRPSTAATTTEGAVRPMPTPNQAPTLARRLASDMDRPVLAS
jgi:hypothetical protein